MILLFLAHLLGVLAPSWQQTKPLHVPLVHTKQKQPFTTGSVSALSFAFSRPPAGPRRPSPGECACEVVSSKKLLGVLVDEDLSFEPCLNEALARGWSSFVQMFNAAESAGFSVAAPLLVTATGVEHKLNRLQWRWALAARSLSRICLTLGACFLPMWLVTETGLSGDHCIG